MPNIKPDSQLMTASSKSTPNLWQLLWQSNRTDLLKVMSLNLVTALVGIGVIGFINQFFLSMSNAVKANIWWYATLFFGLVLMQLASTFVSQFVLTKLGHRFVYDLRLRLLKQILDTPHADIEQIGSAKLLASLSDDVQSLTTAFVRLPELLQGLVLLTVATLYLLSLSVQLTLFIMVWLIFTIAIGTVMVNKVYAYLKKIRGIQDTLYHDYETAIHGHKELMLNRHRSQQFYHQQFDAHADDYRQTIITTDTYHLTAINWSNIMMFTAIGLLFVLAMAFDWADIATTTTIALTLLFIQSPLLSVVGSYPAIQTASVALSKINSLKLAPQTGTFDLTSPKQLSSWQHIHLRNISYTYPNRDDDAFGKRFGLTGIDLTINQGEVVFLIGSNGSGKSTLAKLLVGLYQPDKGDILLDGEAVNDKTMSHYRQHFSAIFGDGHLFDWLMGQGEAAADDEVVKKWLDTLQLTNKLEIQDGKLSTTQLSQGQRKRLALLLTICEDKPILLLDEWAADQDPVYRQVFYERIIPSLKQMGKTLFIISHDDRYFEHADRILQMHAGRLSELSATERQQVSGDAVGHLRGLT